MRTRTCSEADYIRASKMISGDVLPTRTPRSMDLTHPRLTSSSDNTFGRSRAPPRPERSRYSPARESARLLSACAVRSLCREMFERLPRHRAAWLRLVRRSTVGRIRGGRLRAAGSHGARRARGSWRGNAATTAGAHASGRWLCVDQGCQCHQRRGSQNYSSHPYLRLYPVITGRETMTHGRGSARRLFTRVGEPSGSRRVGGRGQPTCP